MVTKSKSDIIKEMQVIAEDVQKKKDEIELLLKVIENLEQNYLKLAEEITKN